MKLNQNRLWSSLEVLWQNLALCQMVSQMVLIITDTTMLTRCSYWDDGWLIHVDATVKCHLDVGKFWSIPVSGPDISLQVRYVEKIVEVPAPWLFLKKKGWHFQLDCLELFKWLWANLPFGSIQLVNGNIPISKQVLLSLVIQKHCYIWFFLPTGRFGASAHWGSAYPGDRRETKNQGEPQRILKCSFEGFSL